MTARWYAIQLLPQCQKTADFNLRRQNFEPFFPRLRIRRSRTEEIIEPLFKGYGFVRLDIEKDQWRSVNGTIGVVGILPKWTETPRPLEDGFVESLLEKDPIEIKQFEDELEEYCPGASIYIKEGILKGRTATIGSDIRSKLLEVIIAGNRSVLISKDYISTNSS